MKELIKALATTGDGAALQPYDLDPILNEELLKLQPLAELLEVVPAGGKTHEYTVRSSHPMGWFEGETTPANFKNSVYQRKTTQVKIQRIWGSVTGFAKTMDEQFVDALDAELTGSLEGLGNTLEYSLLYGCADDMGFTGDAYQFSGILPVLAARASSNIIDAAGAKVTLDLLDQGLGKLRAFRGIGSDPKMWLMDLRMKQVVDGLQTRVSMPLTSTVLNDGQIVMANYGGAPILETDFVSPETNTTSPTVSAAKAAGGSLADNTYKYRISSITMFGEQVGGVESSGVTTETTNNSVDLTWTADANAKLYMIFRKVGSGAYGLIDIIPALTYDANGTVNGTVATYTDDGSKTAVSTVAPLEAGERNIMVLNRNPRRGVALLGKVDDMGRPVNNLYSYIELARTKDSYDYMVKGYLGARFIYPNVAAAVIRRVKVA